jgi:hypothetical protein
VLDLGLAGQVLLVSADAKVDAGDFHGGGGQDGYTKPGPP